MATFNHINDFSDDLGSAVHDLGADVLKIALSNTPPASESSDPTADGNGQLSNVTQVTTNVPDTTLTVVSSSQTGGEYKLVLQDLTITATGGAIPTFRYAYLYNDTATNDELIGYWDYGSGLDLPEDDSLTLDFDSGTGALTIAPSV